ncbi:cingulin-like [Macrobrachium nipponense]|uniref:cingulin-like n=1 Tax=Macrobrachium nipponense TaxID=159736 RepID=UPI0030C805F6
MSLLRQIANICGCGERSSDIIDDTRGYGIPRSNIFNDNCSYAFRHSNIILKLALFLGTVFTLYNIGRKILSLWNGTPELTSPDVSEVIQNTIDIPEDINNAVSTLKEVYDKNLETVEVEMELVRSENSRLRATLLEKENLFDQMTENIDSLRRRVIQDFEGRMNRLDYERSQLRMEQLERSREAEEFQHIIGRLEEQVQALTEDNRKLETENVDKDKVMENLQESNMQCEAMKNGLQQEVRNLSRQNSEMEINVADLTKEKTELEEKMADLGKKFEKEVHDLEQRLSHHQDIIIEKDLEIERLNKEATEKAEMIEELKKQVQSLVEGKKELKIEMEGNIDRLMLEFNNLHTKKDIQIEKCKQDVIEKEEKIEDLENIVQNLLEENKNIKNEMECKVNGLSQELRRQQDLNKEETEKFEIDILEFRQTIGGLESEVVSLLKEKESLKIETEKEMNDLISAKMEKEEKLELFRKEVIACGQTIEGLESEVVSLLKEKESLKIEMEKETNHLISVNMEKEEKLELFKKEVIACGQTIEGLESEVVSLLKEKESLKIEMEKEIMDLKEEMTNLQDMNLERDMEIEKFKREVIENGEIVEVLENEIVSLMKEKDSLKIEMEKEITDLISLNKEKEERLEQFKTEVIDCEQTIESLENGL